MLSKIIMTGLVLGATVTSCSNQSSELKGSKDTIAFSEWCQKWQLDSCDIGEPAKKMPQEQWDAIVHMAHRAAETESELDLDLNLIESPAIQNLLKEALGQEMRSKINDLSLNSIYLGAGELQIGSKNPNQITHNGLNIELADALSITTANHGTLDIAGVEFSDKLDNSLNLSSLDLNLYGVAQVQGQPFNISNLYLEFFMPKADNHEINNSALAHRISEAFLSPDYQWRDAITLSIDSHEAQDIASHLVELVESSKAKEAIANSSAKVEQISFGTQESEMGSIQLKNEIQCEIKLIGVPIIGTKVLEINLAEDFGIEREQRTKNGAKIELFGISTDIGRVKHIELDENEIKIKLGWITVPFDLNPSEDEDDGKGMEFRFCR